MSIVKSRWSDVEIDDNISITECVLKDAIKHGDKIALVGRLSSVICTVCVKRNIHLIPIFCGPLGGRGN